MEINDFKASRAFPRKFLKQYGWNSLNLHGEAGEISDVEFNKMLQQLTKNTLEKNQVIKGWEIYYLQCLQNRTIL